MSDFGNRIRKLEQERAAGDAGLLAAILRRANREGSMSAAIASLEIERGRPLGLDPALRQRAERTWDSMQALARAMFAATDGTAQEAKRS